MTLTTLTLNLPCRGHVGWPCLSPRSGRVRIAFRPCALCSFRRLLLTIIILNTYIICIFVSIPSYFHLLFLFTSDHAPRLIVWISQHPTDLIAGPKRGRLHCTRVGSMAQFDAREPRCFAADVREGGAELREIEPCWHSWHSWRALGCSRGFSCRRTILCRRACGRACRRPPQSRRFVGSSAVRSTRSGNAGGGSRLAGSSSRTRTDGRLGAHRQRACLNRSLELHPAYKMEPARFLLPCPPPFSLHCTLDLALHGTLDSALHCTLDSALHCTLDSALHCTLDSALHCTLDSAPVF
ncbi:uncharacterized protein EKO05_0010558 [Ascochyta rabiei]|uniref:uncharacterized protein n=1 Tax=Didymella rabiei TaxID=5454 RepID=UPI002206E220|nr:uncharacterized protein EKO05_0010558 [Ascochyta rabiei]UPX20322.1 hypothetical protein EKO05_0010558 [Ascochyta rabiei]